MEGQWFQTRADRGGDVAKDAWIGAAIARKRSREEVMGKGSSGQSDGRRAVWGRGEGDKVVWEREGTARELRDYGATA